MICNIFYSITLTISLLTCALAKSQSFYPIHNHSIEILSEHNKSNTSVKIPDVSISDLITVKEFKIYLASVKKDSSTSFFKAQLPSSIHINKKLVRDILKNKSLQNQPMPCITWTVAKNYCIWKCN